MKGLECQAKEIRFYPIVHEGSQIFSAYVLLDFDYLFVYEKDVSYRYAERLFSMSLVFIHISNYLFKDI